MPIWRIQMQIEIAEAGRMTQSGSSLLRLIQNNNMPVLDLLVRESIQNSLDARKTDSKYVNVEFITGLFNSSYLGSELEELTKPLYERYGNQKYDYLAIRDSNTVGLTGVMNYKQIQNNSYGNLLKLVYEICKPHNWDLVMNFPDMKDDDDLIKNPNIRYRYAFVAEPASEEIRKQYLGKKFNKSFDKYTVYLFEY